MAAVIFYCSVADQPVPTAPVVSEDQVKLALRRVKDPDLNLNIIDLGLVYAIEVDGPKVKVDMTLTSPGCPSGPEIMGDAEREIESLPGVESARHEPRLDSVLDPGEDGAAREGLPGLLKPPADEPNSTLKRVTDRAPLKYHGSYRDRGLTRAGFDELLAHLADLPAPQSRNVLEIFHFLGLLARNRLEPLARAQNSGIELQAASPPRRAPS